jgi:transketolase
MSGNKERAMGKANLEVFAGTVEELSQENPRLLVVAGDSRGSGKLGPFAARMPERFVEVGIAEQNLVGVASGLAAAGRAVFAVSPASFLASRSIEQIKHDVCYSDRAVTLVGISAGVSYGALGSTHHSLHDFAALRAMHNIMVVAPADNWETREATRAAAISTIPVYLRFGKQPVPDLPHTADFGFGRARVLRNGVDGAIIATGETVWRALGAAETLGERGYSVAVISVHTVKPLDEEIVCKVASTVRAVVVAEEHSIFGGLGEACASVLLQRGISPRFGIAAIPDEYTVTGTQDEILNHYGISEAGLAGRLASLLEDK